MRHVKRYQELFETQMELSQEQREWLDKCTEGTWALNRKTGLADVNGNFNCVAAGLADFKGVRFGNVSGVFDCHRNELTSLEGAPQEVKGNFDCSYNKLTSLVGAPQQVEGDFECSGNKLTSLEGAPQSVGGNFDCSYNELTSLEGAPQSVGWNFSCHLNELTSLEGAPQEVGGYFDCSVNKLTSLEGAPQKAGWRFDCYGNYVSESVLKSLYKKMQSGMSWPDAVANHWRYIKSEKDKIRLAPSNPMLSPEDVKGYQALAKFRNKIII
jgi:hypothetical protein